MEQKPLTVTALTKYIKYLFEHDPNLVHVYVKGEISNFKHHNRGHFYFTLKDEGAQINAIMFSHKAKEVLFKLENGMKVIVEGYVSVYLSGGTYSITVNQIVPDGIGELYLRYEQLKQKLESEGLFDPAHKKPLVRFPKRIGVITSETGAAIRDIISTLKRRYPLCEVILFPTLVQGEYAKESIIESLERANQYGGIDTIILGRGGGSIEDLWCFNEESVARAIHASKIPVISAIGHETDFTIADFVADVRAATPTAAAELAVPDQEELKKYLEHLKVRLLQAEQNRVIQIKQRLTQLSRSYVFQDPKRILERFYYQSDRLYQQLEQKSPKQNVALMKQRLESNRLRLADRYRTYIERKQQKFHTLIEKLELVNPLNILTKGFVLVKKDEKPVKSITDLEIHDVLELIFHDGKALVAVNHKEGEQYE